MREERELINTRYYQCRELERELDSLTIAVETCRKNLKNNNLHRLRESHLLLKAARITSIIEKISVLDKILKGDD